MPLTPVEAITLLIDDSVTIARLRASHTLRLLERMGRMTTAGQTSLQWDVDLGGGVAAIEAVTANGSNTATDDVKKAILPIGAYRIKHQFPISIIEMRQAANTAPEVLQNLFKAQVERAIDHILRRLNLLIYSGTGSTGDAQVAGFSKICDNTYSYAGLDPVTYTEWTAIVNSNGGTARSISRDLLYSIDEAFHTRESMYSFLSMTPRIATKYKSLFDTTRPLEYLYEGEGTVPVADVGLMGLSYEGKPVIQDPQCTAGSVYFIDPLAIEVASFDVMTGPQPTSGFSQTPIAMASTNLLGININVAELPSNNSAARIFEIYCLPQLKVTQRKGIGLLSDLITT